MARLTDPWFEAEFYGNADSESYRLQGATIEGAQGLFLWCPCGYGKVDVKGKERYPLDLSLNKGRPHGVLVPFANPRNAPTLPPEHGPHSRGDKSVHPRWHMEGSSLEDLTLTPSIAVGDPECWHGFITSGEVK
jgi:hypothetical protein